MTVQWDGEKDPYEEIERLRRIQPGRVVVTVGDEKFTVDELVEDNGRLRVENAELRALFGPGDYQRVWNEIIAERDRLRGLLAGQGTSAMTEPDYEQMWKDAVEQRNQAERRARYYMEMVRRVRELVQEDDEAR